MRTIPIWTDRIQNTDKNPLCIYDVCFHPNGSQLLVAAGNHLLLYSTKDGSLQQTLKGHKDNIYCISATKDGKKFATGSADKSVIIWNNKFEGILKYSHGEAIQCLAYNPSSNILVSCSSADFAFWSQEQKSVQKFKINVRIHCCAWTNDGQYLALGLANGTISIRNTVGEEKGRIERTFDVEQPVWSVAWSTSVDDDDVLCVTDWGKNLVFYSLSGKVINRERSLTFEPLCVSYFPNGEYIMIGGTNKSCVLMTKDGIKLASIGDEMTHWVWACKTHPNSEYVAIGCQDGRLAYYQLIFSTVHSLYQERYAYRENMTDVIIQHLVTDQRVRIKCRDVIKKIAIYKNRLAVQLPERVVIYELNSTQPESLHYKVGEKIPQKMDCNLLVVCSQHLIVCQEQRLLCVTFGGAKHREWIMDSAIRYIKVIGGPQGREGLVVGLKNGQVWKIYLNNPMPIFLLAISAAVRCLDLNCVRDKLAVVDDNLSLHVFDLTTKQLLFTEYNINSVAWNSKHENLLCFSGDNLLALKLVGYATHRRCHAGVVVSFTENKAFCLNGNTIKPVLLPISAAMFQCVAKKEFKESYRLAHIGVTTSDWEELGVVAMDGLDLDVAKNVYTNLQNIHCLNFIAELQNQQKKNELGADLMHAQMLAFRGKFKEAARLYRRSGHATKAVQMYINLRMFDLAQDYVDAVDGGNNKALMREKAMWAENINEPKAAAEMYMSIGDIKSAIELMGKHKWVDMLIDVSQRIDKDDRANMTLVAEYLRDMNEITAASDLYRRLGDEASLLKLYVDTNQWEQSFALVDKHPELNTIVYVPYAQWLIENDKFVEAQKAFHKAGKPESAFDVLFKLTRNALDEHRYQDAGYLHWIMAHQCLDLARASQTNDQQTENVLRFKENQRLSTIYYAYNALYRYLQEPFTSYIPEALFNIARFVMNEIRSSKPSGVSQFTVLYSLAKQAKLLGANKLAKQLFDQIRNLKVPLNFQEQVEVATLSSFTKSFNDPEDLLPMCYRCSTYNSLISKSNACSHCHQPFVFSHVSFEILPLIEFELESDITDGEAVRLIESPPDDHNPSVEKLDVTQQVLSIDDSSSRQLDDPFLAKIHSEDGDAEFCPVIVNRDTLQSLDPSVVIVCKWPAPLRYQYFKNLLPDLDVCICHSCFKTFHADDFELQLLQKNACPFCKADVDVAIGKVDNLTSP